jgi:hypothetical protein
MIFSPCFFGHADDPLKVVRGKALHFECRRCGQDLGIVLPKQKFKARKRVKPQTSASKVFRIALRSQRSWVAGSIERSRQV